MKVFFQSENGLKAESLNIEQRQHGKAKLNGCMISNFIILTNAKQVVSSGIKSLNFNLYADIFIIKKCLLINFNKKIKLGYN